MEMDPSEKIADLRRRLAEAEQNTMLAAKYGKELLETNSELHKQMEEMLTEHNKKIEELVQENHSLGLKLEHKIQYEQSMAMEIESQREHYEKMIREKKEALQQAHQNDINKYTKKISHLESDIGTYQLREQQQEEHIKLLEDQMSEAQGRLDQCNTSTLNQTSDDFHAMQSQMISLTCEKQELEKEVSTLKARLTTAQHKLSLASSKVDTLEAEIEEKLCQNTSYFNALEKNKEEMMELQMEIESLRLAETDPNKKGNSLFSEVEDQRQIMQKQLLTLKNSYNLAKKQCEIKSSQISKMKLQIASLLSLSSSKADSEYLAHLEESVSNTRSQVDHLTKRCKHLEEQLASKPQQKIAVPAVPEGSGQNMTTFFQNMYMDSQDKVKVLEGHLQSIQFEKVALSDRILQLQRNLHTTEKARNASHSEAIRLRVRLEEMAGKKGEKIDQDKKERKHVIEKLPTFSSQQSSVKQESNVVSDSDSSSTSNTIASKEWDASELLQEKSVDQNTNAHTDETSTEKQHKVIESDDKENGENMAPNHKFGRSKLKKSVRMMDAVVMQDEDGQVESTSLKQEDGHKKVERKKKVLRKMEAPVIKVSSQGDGEQNECKQQ